ncbi:MAG TPA: helix-turn-helix domain-containing protein, partial [Nitrososphaeraceae archaeon]|nr:helix-turn-helix domain-containing protein [Nitrososphaeraceae archaeon]
MLLPAEIEAKSLIPAIRSILARKLINDYGLKEELVAKVLGVTQAAISNYVRGTRGDVDLISKLGSVDHVIAMIDDIARDLAGNKAYTPYTMS